MCTDAIVGDAQSHPHNILRTRTATHHLHDPRLVRVADREGLALRAVSVGLHETRHHLDSFAGGLGTLQAEIHQRTVVDNARGVHHLLATAEGSLTDAHLILIDVADDVVRHGSLRNPPMTHRRVVVVDPALLILGMRASSIVAQACEQAIVVGIVGTEHTTVGTCVLADDEIGTG